MAKVCPKCHTHQKDDKSLFCMNCGTKLPNVPLKQNKHERSFKYSTLFYSVVGLDIFISFVMSVGGFFSYFDIYSSSTYLNPGIGYWIVPFGIINLFLDVFLIANAKGTPKAIDSRLCWSKVIFGFLGIITSISGFYFAIISFNMYYAYNAEIRRRKPSEIDNREHVDVDGKTSVSVNFNYIDSMKFRALSQIKKDELVQLIVKYLDSKISDFHDIIIKVHSKQDDVIKKYGIRFDINNEDGLTNSIELFESCLKETKKKASSCHSIDEKKALENECKFYSNQIELLNDLSKLQKILHNREIVLSRGGILELLFSLIQEKRFQAFRKILEPYLTGWKEKLGNNPSIELILKEVTNTKFDFFSDEDSVLNQLGYRWILSQFGYNLPIESIENQLKPILKERMEKRELEKFEKKLDKRLKDQLISTDFSLYSGYDFEEFIASLFQKMGYTVDVTPKSRDQGADIILRRDNEITAVQVKNYSNSVSNSAIQEVFAAKKYYQANKAMVVTSSFFTPSAIDLAHATDVILWDRDKLKQEIDSLNRQ
jgi:Holliday junction resolvase-like predicted endonuclease